MQHSFSGVRTTQSGELLEKRLAPCLDLNILIILIPTYDHIVHVDGEKKDTTSVSLSNPDAFFHLPTHLFEFGSFCNNFAGFC